MGTRFIFINLLIITSFTVKVTSGENEESSWTQLLRYKKSISQNRKDKIKFVMSSRKGQDEPS